MSYNLTNFTSANNFLDMAVASNQLVDGWLAIMIVMLVLVITFVNMKGFELKHALMTSAFITFILTGALWGVGFASERTLVITFVLMLFSLAFAIITD